PMAKLMEKASVPTAFVLGAFVGLTELPCTGGPYLFVLGLLHDSTTYFEGFGFLLLYNIIFVAPLVVILGFASDPTILAKAQEWKKQSTGSLRFWGGLAMLALGTLILMF
ncbi:MAG TPA: hypothetical protein VMC43_03960, partial [Candidatus Paceibacterota bacterium]|nr:hypothetical protein [Candidatus Paceibacterota bacterium]